MSNAKIRIKVGSMELDYEGEPSFLTEGIEALLTTMGDLAGRIPKELPVLAEESDGVNFAVSTGNSTFSTNTLAAYLEVKTALELVICAISHLEIVQGKTASSRAEILAEMRSATTYFNGNMVGNLSKTLSSLTKGKRINQITKDTYSLSSSERKKIEAKVAEIG
ncbi:hypothetical protein [Thalassospira sp. MCCC 1A01428]|uniref:hypothetical protein n=1 Tax=Thalassospira sp. MCCC 1A01428 TaxID=1470575 RepID=UPI000A20075C|nr:hypothetical protein [Thalassospira sp. MCCC 1A01428]OSQ44108.1 hypothetical protein THS27_07705 [Thalassospira sp. MCCC 1A01428]